MTTPFDSLDLDEFSDYESEDLTVDEAEDEDDATLRGRNAFINSMWDRYGFDDMRTAPDKADALIVAHRMVQQFVNTFSGDGAYHVTFSPSMSTAGTDIIGKKVVITPAPVFDPTLTPQQAGVILTAMAAHEASHPRYGRETLKAVFKVFGKKRSPRTLSNILEDVRIERRFAAEYPGYADVFKPMIAYVARSYRDKGILPKLTDQMNLMTLAVRYAEFVDWPTPEVVAERDWWQMWAARWSREDAPRKHIEAVREGLRHVAVVKARRKAIEELKAKKEAKAQAEEPEAVKRLKEAIAAMTPTERNVLRLVSQKRTGNEIAAVLSMSHDQAVATIGSVRFQCAMAVRGVDLKATVAQSLKQVLG